MSLRSIKKTFVRNRMAHDPSVPNQNAPAVIDSITSEAADTVRLTFNTRVVNSKLPGFTAGTDGEETVESMSLVSDTVVELVFTGDVAGTNMIVQGGDPGIRTPSGGFVPAGTYAIPTFP
jgi:hypothetical protein